MKTVEIKIELLEEILDQLKDAQNDCFVLDTQDVINKIEVLLKDSK